MKDLMLVHDIVEANGKTIKENNLAKPHSIPEGALVEVQFDEWYSDGACAKIHARLWVIVAGRDCDGSPVYWLSKYKTEADAKCFGSVHGAFDADSLTVIEITDEIRDGAGALTFD